VSIARYFIAAAHHFVSIARHFIFIAESYSFSALPFLSLAKSLLAKIFQLIFIAK
jgi:hypothetical protein